MTLLGGQPVPAHSFGLVLENALAVGVHDPEVELGTGVTLLGGQPGPAHSFGLVLENAPPVGVHDPEVELGIGVTLLGGQPGPAHSFGLVLENALAVGVHDPEAELGTGVAHAQRERGTLAPLWHSRHGHTLPQLRQMPAPPRPVCRAA